MSDNKEQEPRGWHPRFSLNQRIQHILVLSSFVVLMITGMPVRYHEAKISKLLILLQGGMAGREVLHRVGALVLIGLCVYHLAYVLLSRKGHEDFLALMPTKKDISDLFTNLKWYFGLWKERALGHRFTYIEKFEYWAVVWGSVIMVFTGLMLWFEEGAMLIVPKWALDITRVVHSYEALLAFLAIIIWHLYNVHLNPTSFPMSKTWLTGMISEEEMKELHPLEYEKLQREHKQGP